MRTILLDEQLSYYNSGVCPVPGIFLNYLTFLLALRGQCLFILHMGSFDGTLSVAPVVNICILVTSSFSVQIRSKP